MNFPKTSWNYSAQTEAIRILQAAYSTRNRFFQKKGFFVLPYRLDKNPKCVFLPPLPLVKTSFFWNKARTKSQMLAEHKDVIIEKIIKELPPCSENLSQIKTAWKKTEKQFWITMNQMMPQIVNKIRTLEIRPTRYGAIATGYSLWLPEQERGHIIVYVRTDANVSHIFEAIFIDTIYPILYEESYSWEECEAISDFLITQTSLKKLSKGYEPTLFHLRKKTEGKYAKEAENYLHELGIKSSGLFQMHENKIFIDKKEFNPLLTPLEERITKAFVEKKNSLISNDELADIIWGKDSFDKYSSYAIAKHIQRIREKIESTGLSSAVLQTFKKKGYILID